MKIKFYKEDDILVLNFSDKAVENSYEAENAILEVDKNNIPVSLEILHASQFFTNTSKELPQEIKTKYFTSA